MAGVKTPLDLTQEQLVTFGQVVHGLSRENPDRSFLECYRVALEAWGLRCHHPPHGRMALKPGSDAYECEVCRSYVVRTCPGPGGIVLDALY